MEKTDLDNLRAILAQWCEDCDSSAEGAALADQLFNKVQKMAAIAVKPARFRPFPPVSCRYGAPMGRHGAELDSTIPLDRLAVSGPAGEYDSGGAYWGYGGESGPVWAVWERGKGRQGVAYVRARGRVAAKMRALHGDDLRIEIQPNGRVRCTIGEATDSTFVAGYGGHQAEAMAAAQLAFIAAQK